MVIRLMSHDSCELDPDVISNSSSISSFSTDNEVFIAIIGCAVVVKYLTASNEWLVFGIVVGGIVVTASSHFASEFDCSPLNS